MKNPGTIFEEIFRKIVHFCYLSVKMVEKNTTKIVVRTNQALPNTTKIVVRTIPVLFFSSQNRAYLYFSRARIVHTDIFLEKNSGTHDLGDSIVWSPF